MIASFEDREYGGYFMTADHAERLITRPKETYDGALPSGNSVAAMVLQHLSSLTGEPAWQEAADRQLRFIAADMKEYPMGHCFGLLAMMHALYPHRELVCASQNGVPDELADWLKRTPEDNLQILLKTAGNGDALAQCAPFTGDYPVPAQGAVYYLCENGACKAPVTEFNQLHL